MENKEMKNMVETETEKVSGGAYNNPFDPIIHTIKCPKCGSADVTHLIAQCHCNKCGHEWKEVIC